MLTEVPGPEGRELHARREGAVAGGAGMLHPVYVEKAEGAILVDIDGNQYADLGCGIGVTTVGHSHPRVVAAAQEQAAKLVHTLFTVTPHRGYVELAERLCALVPGEHEKRALFVTSGAEAVENAVKIARKFTGRGSVVALEHAFHGRTNLTMSMTYRTWPERTGMGPIPGGVYNAPGSYPFRDGLTGEEAAARTIDYIERHVGTSDVAAIFVEPVLGDGGVVIPAPGYLPALRSFCDREGVLLVADEVQTGFGRTGDWFAIDREEVVPDMLTVAKGLGGGFPLAGVVGRAEIMDSVQPGGVGGTFGGSPVSVAAALAVLDLIESEDLLAEVKTIEGIIGDRLRLWDERFDVVAEVRGRGAMFGVEFAERPGRTGAAVLTDVLRDARNSGVIALDAGTWDSVLRIMPPINVDLGLLSNALDVLEQSIQKAGNE